MHCIQRDDSEKSFKWYRIKEHTDLYHIRKHTDLYHIRKQTDLYHIKKQTDLFHIKKQTDLSHKEPDRPLSHKEPDRPLSHKQPDRPLSHSPLKMLFLPGTVIISFEKMVIGLICICFEMCTLLHYVRLTTIVFKPGIQ